MSASIRSSINLFNGFSDRATLKAVGYQLSATQQTRNQTRQNVIYQIATRYLNAMVTTEQVRIEEENISSITGQLTRMEALQKAGNRSMVDLLQIRADLASAEFRLLTARSANQNAKNQLILAMGVMDISNDFSLLTPAIAVSADSLNRLLGILTQDSSLSSKPDIQAQKASISSAEEALTSARGGLYPSLSLSLSYGSSYRSNSTGIFSDQFIDNNPSFSTGLTLSYPIFDRFSTKLGHAKARIRLENERLSLQDKEITARLQLRQALLDYNSAVQQKQSAQLQVDYVQQALDAMTARYNSGGATYTELSTARNQFVRATGEKIQADYNLLVKLFNIAYSNGEIDQAVEFITAKEN